MMSWNLAVVHEVGKFTQWILDIEKVAIDVEVIIDNQTASYQDIACYKFNI